MTDQSAAPTAPAALASAPGLPLFYRALQPLQSAVHGQWRLTDGDASFAADTSYVPIVTGELAAASRDYPVVFAADAAQPVVILGLERRNLFIEDGRWSQNAYVPAYVRRYPFAFIVTEKPDGFMLAIDSGSERFAQGAGEGAALFEDGQPSALTRQALDFCTAFGREADLTALFTTALKEKDLLTDRRADATLPDGRKLGLDGFQIVDAEKLAKLDDETIVAWQRQGILALVHFHLASLERFGTLLDRHTMHASVTQSSPADASEAPVTLASAPGAIPAEASSAPSASQTKSKKA